VATHLNSNKKKAQGKARKAKQNPKCEPHSCKHFNSSAYTEDEHARCMVLYNDLNNEVASTAHSALKSCAEDFDQFNQFILNEFHKIAREMYSKYRELNETSRQLFRELTLSMVLKSSLKV
jgi:hypothetical protein